MHSSTPLRPRWSLRPVIPVLLWLLSAAATVSAQVTISDDLGLGAYSPNRTRWQRAIPVCVWNADGVGLYRVRVTGQTAGSDYAMRNAIGDRIPYQLRWYSAGASGPAEQLRSAIDSARSYRFVDERTCLETDTPPHMEVTASRKDVDRAPPGNYTDLLSVTVSPL